MEVQKRKRYSKEFKEDVLNMLKTGDKTVPFIAKELGIAEAMIYRWYKAKGGGSVEGEKLSAQEKEIRELRSKLADVTEERDILKKAVNIFSKQGTLK
jgi:transposase